MSARDGGPAFPETFWESDGGGIYVGAQKPGMSLRDYFAGQALVGSASELDWGAARGYEDRAIASRAYQLADAMLAAREAGE